MLGKPGCLRPNTTNQYTHKMVKSNNLKLTLCAGLALAGLTGSVFAGAPVVAKETTTLVEETTQSAITGDLGVNFTSQYINRGVVRENQGVIAQPYVDLYFNLYEGEGFINKVSLDLGAWSSLHSAKTHAHPHSTTNAWYEFDYSVGLGITFARDFTFTPSYVELNSPNDAFKASRNVNLRLDYDDSELLGAFALRPHVSYLRELQGSLGNGTSKGNGNYYEVGVAPGAAFGPVAVTVPLNAGFGSHNFYGDNQGFGYFSGGVNASVALSFIPAAYGAWTFNTGATYYYLHGTLSQANSIQRSGNNTFVFNGGLNLAF